MVDTLEATYRITTPMFLTRDSSTAELRATSFKGVLRFWFRALALAQYGSWQAVKKAEEHLFGGSGAGAGQGMFLLRMEGSPNLNKEPRGTRWADAGSAYLGYGVIQWDRGLRALVTTREYIKHGQSFTVTLRFRRQPDDTQRRLLHMSLQSVGLFGGLGARSRNGFGSITLVRLRDGQEELWQPPETIEQLQDRINDLTSESRHRVAGDLPEYTAFTAHARVEVHVPDWGRVPQGTDRALWLLNETGREMLRYRSFGTPGPNGRRVTATRDPAEQNFRADHDHMLYYALNGRLESNMGRPPRRAIFGLPHNYYFRSKKVRVEVNAGQHDRRRASPLFIHIHDLGQHRYALVLALLPARFLPEDERLRLTRRLPGDRKPRDEQFLPVPDHSDYEVIGRFLDRWKEGTSS